MISLESVDDEVWYDVSDDVRVEMVYGVRLDVQVDVHDEVNRMVIIQ